METVKEIFEKRVEATEERMARCIYCGKECKSAENARLAFFREQPEMDYDSYYCGCYGWD